MSSTSRILCLIIPLIVSVSCSGGGSTSAPDNSGDNIVEIREYMGEPLTSTNDMRENSITGPQAIDIETWRLRVEGLADNPREFTYQELLERESVKRVVWVHCVDGWSAKILWEGFRLADLLDQVEIQNEASHVIFYGADGFHNYLTVNFIRINDIIVATHANGKPLRVDRGFPLHVISQSKYGYKWCKWVERMVLSDGANDAGFYENRGYSKDGNVGDHPYDPDESRLQP